LSTEYAVSVLNHAVIRPIQGGPKSKTLPNSNDQKIILNHIKACQ